MVAYGWKDGLGIFMDYEYHDDERPRKRPNKRRDFGEAGGRIGMETKECQRRINRTSNSFMALLSYKWNGCRSWYSMFRCVSSKRLLDNGKSVSMFIKIKA